MLGLPKHLKQLISLLICSYFLFCWEIWTLQNTKNFCWRNLRVQSFYTISDLQFPHFHQAKSGLDIKICWSKPGATTCFRTERSSFFLCSLFASKSAGNMDHRFPTSFTSNIKALNPTIHWADKNVQMNR